MISVIIPTYKPENYLFDCLESLANQTLAKDNYEVIVILNGPINPYKEAIEDWINNHNGVNFRLFSTEIPGVSNARNLGISKAVGDYIAFIDDDDIVSPNYLSGMVPYLNDSCVVVSDVRTFSDSITENGQDYISKAYAEQRTDDDIFYNRRFLSSSCCKIIPKRIIGDCRFDSSLTLGEDSLFMFSISKNIKKIIKADKDSLYYRRLRKGSASRSKLSFKNRMMRKLVLCAKYSKIYFKDILHYNLPLYASRVFATLIK